MRRTLESISPDKVSFFPLCGVAQTLERDTLNASYRISARTKIDHRALERALFMKERPEILNADRGSQFTSEAFTWRSEEEDIKICMDGKGRWRNNVFVECIWKSTK